MILLILELFIPITAKQYYENPDVMIALINVLGTVLCLSYFVSFLSSFSTLLSRKLFFQLTLLNLVKFRAVLYSTLLAIFITSLILSFTSIGFPYSADKTNPRIQRFSVMHSKRTFYNSSSSETFADVGFLISTIDRNSVRTLEISFGAEKFIDWKEDEKCEKLRHCGFPLYRFSEGKYMKANGEMPTVKPVKFTLKQAKRNPNNSSQLLVNFSLKLSTLTMIHVIPGSGWKYVNGSLPSSQRFWMERPSQFTKITFGKNLNEEMDEFVVLEVNFAFDLFKL
jgi:hypothetical protein